MFEFGDNLVKLRKSKGITQEELAEFVGVTKASVSKWETKQSMPDIGMLPLLSSYFDVSIDSLLGYHPKLSKEEIEQTYGELAEKFAKEPFEMVMKESEELVKQYYSCYPFLFQIAVLWLNHHMLAEDTQRRNVILENACDLCSIIVDKEKDQVICNDAITLKAQILLMLGRYEEVVDSLKGIADPLGLSAQSHNLLIQAYQAKGDTEMAERYSQLHLYIDILGIISHSTLYLTNNIDNELRCEETIERVLEVMKTYHFLKINPNTCALFFLQAATVYATYDRKDKFLQMLEKYVDAIYALFEKEVVLIQGDSYFDKLELMIAQRRETKQAPRDKKVIFQSAMSMFEYPLFLKYKDEETFITLKQKLERKGEEICK